MGNRRKKKIVKMGTRTTRTKRGEIDVMEASSKGIGGEIEFSKVIEGETKSKRMNI